MLKNIKIWLFYLLMIMYIQEHTGILGCYNISKPVCARTFEYVTPEYSNGHTKSDKYIQNWCLYSMKHNDLHVSLDTWFKRHATHRQQLHTRDQTKRCKQTAKQHTATTYTQSKLEPERKSKRRSEIANLNATTKLTANQPLRHTANH